MLLNTACQDDAADVAQKVKEQASHRESDVVGGDVVGGDVGRVPRQGRVLGCLGKGSCDLGLLLPEFLCCCSLCCCGSCGGAADRWQRQVLVRGEGDRHVGYQSGDCDVVHSLDQRIAAVEGHGKLVLGVAVVRVQVDGFCQRGS